MTLTLIILNTYAGIMSVVLSICAYKIHQLSNVTVLKSKDVYLEPMVNGRDIIYWVEAAQKLGHKEPCMLREEKGE